jgi:proteasome beta subunit
VILVPHSKTFAELVGYSAASGADARRSGSGRALDTAATTVLAVRYNQGVLLLGDKRATAGNLVMFDQAEKIVPLDDSTVIAISGSFAKSIEIARYLKHSFKYYRRTTMAEMSLDGKLMEITRALAANMPMAMEGIGVFLPIVAAYDRPSDSFSVHFFDGAGARFQNGEYACAGSGSERIRGVFEYLARTEGPWPKRKYADVLLDALRMLDIAADLDAATGGIAKSLPVARILDRDGSREAPAEDLQRAAQAVLKARDARSAR